MKATIIMFLGIVIGALPAFGENFVFQSPCSDGTLTLSFRHIDDILKLEGDPSLRIVEIKTASAEAVSSAHLALLLRWIEGGGVLWFHGRGFESSLFEKVNPGIKLDRDLVFKESGALFTAQTGELFLRDLLPHIAIAEHRITEGVNMIYVRPSDRIVRPPGAGPLDASFVLETSSPGIVPILYFMPSEIGLHFGRLSRRGPQRQPEQKLIVFGIVERGDGLIIVDLTGIAERRWDGPDGNVYDGPKFYENIRNFGSQ